MRLIFSALTFCSFLVVACGGKVTATQRSLEPTPSPTHTSQPAITHLITPNPTVSQVTVCEDWQLWPVIPIVSEAARELYQRGQASGNNPRAFSKIGDGEISTEWFFTAFDLGEDYYDLGPYQNLIPAIEHFAGSFERMGTAARRGFNTQRSPPGKRSHFFTTMNPLTCEVRLHQLRFILSLPRTGLETRRI
jgi:hypothetical protein